MNNILASTPEIKWFCSLSEEEQKRLLTKHHFGFVTLQNLTDEQIINIYNSEAQIVWEIWATRVIKHPDGTAYVNTPISCERGFLTEEDAVAFAESFGRVDRRPEWVVSDALQVGDFFKDTSPHNRNPASGRYMYVVDENHLANLIASNRVGYACYQKVINVPKEKQLK